LAPNIGSSPKKVSLVALVLGLEETRRGVKALLCGRESGILPGGRKRTVMEEKRSRNKSRDLRLYLASKPLLLVDVFGSLVALTGLVLLLTQGFFWQPLLVGCLLLCCSGIVFWYALWLRRTPVFLANVQGIHTRYLALRVSIPWEEIIAVSAAGDLLIKKRLDTRPPHTIVILQGSVPLPAEQVLALLQERFHEQFARYGISVQHGPEDTSSSVSSAQVRERSGPAKDVQPQ